MKTKKTTKVTDLISNKVAEQLEELKVSKPKAKTSKKTSKETPKLVELKPKASKKSEVVKEVEKQQKSSIIEKVISNREVKYIYPEGMEDTLSKKKWRQSTRNELHRLEREMFRIKDENSKEFKAASKAYETFKKKVLKPDQVA